MTQTRARAQTATQRFHDATCAVCARAATGFGYSPSNNWHRHPPMFVCDDPECLNVVRTTYSMPQERFSRIEAMAAAKAAEAMGEALDEMGLGHLFEGAGLSWEQWLGAMRDGIAGYRVALQTDLRNEAPF